MSREEKTREDRSEISISAVSEDVEELRGVLSAISEFLSSIKAPIKEIIETLGGSLDGSKLGEEVGNFYSNLISAGIPEDMAKKMTEEFFRRKLESAPTISNLMNTFMSAMKGPMGQKRSENVESVMERVIKELDKASEKYGPEAKPFIEAIKKSLKEKYGLSESK